MNNFTKEFLAQNMMGPNSLRIVEELTQNLALKKGMRILDLGCGRGLTSIYLAQKFDLEVFAVDLWTDPTENIDRFKSFGLEKNIIPLRFDASSMPFAHNFFDAIISVDSYHYFGNTGSYFGDFIKPILKKEALVGIAFPSIRQDFEFNQIPDEMKPFWEEEAFNMWHSTKWWTDIFTPHLANFKVEEMKCFKDAWQDWLELENEYAIGDRAMMQADNGRYMNILSFTGTVIKD